MHAFYLSTLEAEAGGFLSRGQPCLQTEFQGSQSYSVRLYLQKEKQKQKKLGVGLKRWLRALGYKEGHGDTCL